MDKNEFNKLSSAQRKEKCPDCGTANTEPQPGCPCRREFGFHVMKYHHECTPTNGKSEY